MTVFRPTYHSPIYEPATYFAKKGVKLVRFRLLRSGELVTGEVMPNGKARIESPLWYARIRKNGRTVRVALGVTDKTAAEQLAAQLQLAAHHQRAGIIDPHARHRDTKMADHLDDYRLHLEANGCCDRHIKETVAMIGTICRSCGFHTPDDLDTPPLTAYLAGLIRKGRSYRTRNKALKGIRALVHYMLQTDRLAVDPFRTITLLNQEADPNRKVRRALLLEEFTNLVSAAEAGPVVQGVTGQERALLYMTAASTGCRRGELAKLCVRDVVLDAEFPYIALPAKIAKSRREAVIPLHPAVATRLAGWVEARNTQERLFHLLADIVPRRTSKMMMADLKAAGVPYRTADGVADFHALRTTFITNTCRLTDQFTAMKLARHTKATITAKHYDKVLLSQRANVVGQLQLPAPAKS